MSHPNSSTPKAGKKTRFSEDLAPMDPRPLLSQHGKSSQAEQHEDVLDASTVEPSGGSESRGAMLHDTEPSGSSSSSDIGKDRNAHSVLGSTSHNVPF